MHIKQTQEKVLNKWNEVNHRTIGINWAQGSISEWSHDTYTLSKQRLIWRNHIVEISADVTRNVYGATVMVRFVHNGIIYTSLFTKHKYMAGSHGDQLPVIATDTHRLHIRPYITGLTLCDVPLNDKFVGTKDAFEIRNKVIFQNGNIA